MKAPDQNQPTQVLEFLAVTGVPKRGSRSAADAESRRIVRSHAIRDANRRKKCHPETYLPKKTPARSNPLPQSNFTAKFRVAKRKKKIDKVEKVEEVEKFLDVDESLKSLLQEIVSKRKNQIVVLSGNSRFDPFDTLPVTIGSRETALIHFRKLKLCQVSCFL